MTHIRQSKSIMFMDVAPAFWRYCVGDRYSSNVDGCASIAAWLKRACNWWNRIQR